MVRDFTLPRTKEEYEEWFRKVNVARVRKPEKIRKIIETVERFSEDKCWDILELLFPMNDKGAGVIIAEAEDEFDIDKYIDELVLEGWPEEGLYPSEMRRLLKSAASKGLIRCYNTHCELTDLGKKIREWCKGFVW